MKTLFIFITCFLVSVAVLADNINPQVSFNVTGGEQEESDPYVCNVGMRHVNIEHNICRNIETRETCIVADGTTPSCCADDPTKCECTTSKGRFMLDFIRFTDLNSDSDNHILNASYDPNAPLNMLYSGIYGSVIPMYSETEYPIISELNYNMSSEIYGTEYFLDVCYPAPGECKTVTYDKTYIQSTDFLGDTLGYANLAHPNIKIEQVGGSSNCLNNAITQPMMSSTIINIIDESNPIKIEGVDAGCVIRFHFNETNTQAMRKWQRHDQTYKIKIRSEIEDTCDGGGCSRTPGYWKTHADPSKKSYDETWLKVPEEVPGYLPGVPNNNENQNFYGYPATWLQILSEDHDCGVNDGSYESTYRCLGKQWVAATLNTLAGAPKEPISLQWEQARQILMSWPIPHNGGGPAARAEMLMIKDHLDAYNNGLLPGTTHCE